MIVDRNNSVLVIVDVQEKLAATMPGDELERLIHTGKVLLQAAAMLDIPVLVTEQYRKGLGHTLPELASNFPRGLSPINKTCFACNNAQEFLESLRETGCKQVVLVGMETHICILQTAMGLLDHGYQVFVPGDGVCSRSLNHKRNAMNRMINNGVQISNVESVLFEWLRDAKHGAFKTLSALIR